MRRGVVKVEWGKLRYRGSPPLRSFGMLASTANLSFSMTLPMLFNSFVECTLRLLSTLENYSAFSDRNRVPSTTLS
jgi:hypothetical protein